MNKHKHTGIFVKARSRIYKLCKTQPTHIEEIAKHAKLTTSQTLDLHLTPLTKKGLAQMTAPGVYKTGRTNTTTNNAPRGSIDPCGQ